MRDYYLETIKKAKLKLVKKGESLEKQIYLSEERKLAGGRVHLREPRIIAFLHGGKITVGRRKYWRIVNGKKEFTHLLDRRLGWKKKVRLDGEVKKEIISLLRKGESGVAIKDWLAKEGVQISRMTVSETLRKGREGGKEEKESKISLPRNILYFNLDEAHIVTRKANHQIEKTRIRSVSAYTGRIGDKVKKRGRLVNKRYFVETYREGELVDSGKYAERLGKFLGSLYIINKQTLIFGATDGAPSLKKVVKLTSQTLLIASKFHVQRNQTDPGYLENNQEGIANGKHPACLGYSAESDISYLKRKLGFGNRVYSGDGFRNLLKMDGIRVT